MEFAGETAVTACRAIVMASQCHRVVVGFVVILTAASREE